MVALLMEYGLAFSAPQEEAYKAMIKVSTGEMGFERLREWLGENTTH